ncbi:hypothetical protein ACWIID_10355 [Streptomyces phaeochromogenes]
MPRYVRVKIITPEIEAAERRAGIILGLVLAAAVVQVVGTFFVALGIRHPQFALVVMGVPAIVLGAWGAQFVDSRVRNHPLKTWKFVASIAVSAVVAVVGGTITL